MIQIRPSEITPEHTYLSRRTFLLGLGGAATTALLGSSNTSASSYSASDAASLSKELTAYKSITNYNNYYEFSSDKESVAHLSQRFRTAPWTVTVTGLV